MAQIEPLKPPVFGAPPGDGSSPLDDAGFLLGARCYVRAVDSLAPLFGFMLARLDESSGQCRQLKSVHVFLDGMASAVAGRLVERGEQLRFGAPPSPELIALAFHDSSGQDDHDALDLCLTWCRAIDDVLWHFEGLGVGGAAAQKLMGAMLDESLELVIHFQFLHLVREALVGLRTLMVDRLRSAKDRFYLNEAKHPAVRVLQLPGVLHA